MTRGECVGLYNANAWVISLDFYSYNTLISGQSDGKVKIWDLEKKELAFTFNDQSAQVCRSYNNNIQLHTCLRFGELHVMMTR